MLHKSKEPRLQTGLGLIQSATYLCLEAYKKESLYGDEVGVRSLEAAISELLKVKSRYLDLIRQERGE